jgi:hypothetical protein
LRHRRAAEERRREKKARSGKITTGDRFYPYHPPCGDMSCGEKRLGNERVNQGLTKG